MNIPIDHTHREELDQIKKEAQIKDPEILLEEYEGIKREQDDIASDLERQKKQLAAQVRELDIMKEINAFKEKKNSFWERLKTVFGPQK